MSGASGDLNLDFAREARIGLPEAAFCLQKSEAQIRAILKEAADRDAPMLLTRLSQIKTEAICGDAAVADRLDYDPVSQTAFFNWRPASMSAGRVAIVAAGTSDAPATREADRVLAYAHEQATMIMDVGVAGLWRLMARAEEIAAHQVVIVVAGMDAALPSVVGGLAPGVVIAVPTSTGYGVARGGETALAASLASCAPGVVVCNIDNGYGAACAALRVLQGTKADRGAD